MEPEEMPQSLVQAVAALEQHLVEQNKLQAETNRLYEQRLDLERKRLELGEEANHLYLRSVAQFEENGQRYNQRLVEQRSSGRWALAILVVLVVVLLVFFSLFPSVHHPR